MNSSPASNVVCQTTRANRFRPMREASHRVIGVLVVLLLSALLQSLRKNDIPFVKPVAGMYIWADFRKYLAAMPSCMWEQPLVLVPYPDPFPSLCCLVRCHIPRSCRKGAILRFVRKRQNTDHARLLLPGTIFRLLPAMFCQCVGKSLGSGVGASGKLPEILAVQVSQMCIALIEYFHNSKKKCTQSW